MGDADFDIYLEWLDQNVRVQAGITALAALLAAGVPIEPVARRTLVA
jgi:hypothetical protein